MLLRMFFCEFIHIKPDCGLQAAVLHMQNRMKGTASGPPCT